MGWRENMRKGRGVRRTGVRRGGWENRRRTENGGRGDVACFIVFFFIAFYFDTSDEFDLSITNNIEKI